MFKKISLIALILVGTTGAYALVANLFPETVEFPRIPMRAGTIGEMLSKLLGTTDIEGSDGTVGNTMTLSGESARGYLQHTTCTNFGEVWIGIDADGKAICGPKGGIPLAFGYVQDFSGTVTIVHADNSTTPVTGPHQLVVVGDIIQTSLGASATIGFDADNSVLRLDEGTLVELQQSELGGNTVAEAILQDGSLWGRVLTSTGINFSADGYIAGVRGTSIAMTKNGSDVSIAIPHSRNSAPGTAGTLTCPQSSTTLSVGSSFTLTGELSCPHTVGTSTLATLYTNEWIRENTKKDILAMSIDKFEYVSGGSDTIAIKNEILDSEMTATVPSDNLAACQSLIVGEVLSLSGITQDSSGISLSPTTLLSIDSSSTQLSNTSCSDITNINNRTVSPQITRCAIEGKNYWPIFDTFPLSVCQDPTNLLVANLTDSTLSGNLYTKDGARVEIGGGLPPTYAGISISTTGQYISYDTGAINATLPDHTLAGKTVTVTITGPLTVGGTLVDFGYIGTSYRIQKQSVGYKCSWTGGDCVTPNGDNLTFTIPTTIKYFVLGNNYDAITSPSLIPSLSKPIGGTFTKILIK